MMLIEQLADEMQKFAAAARDAALRCNHGGLMHQRRIAQVLWIGDQPLRLMRQRAGKVCGDVLMQRMLLLVLLLRSKLFFEAG